MFECGFRCAWILGLVTTAIHYTMSTAIKKKTLHLHKMVAVQTLSNVSGQSVRAGKTQPFLDNEVRNALRVHVMDVGPMTNCCCIDSRSNASSHVWDFYACDRAVSIQSWEFGSPTLVTLRRHHFVWGERVGFTVGLTCSSLPSCSNIRGYRYDVEFAASYSPKYDLFLMFNSTFAVG